MIQTTTILPQISVMHLNVFNSYNRNFGYAFLSTLQMEKMRLSQIMYVGPGFTGSSSSQDSNSYLPDPEVRDRTRKLELLLGLGFW